MFFAKTIKRSSNMHQQAKTGKKDPQKTPKLVIKMRHAVNRFTFAADPMGKIKRRG